MDWVYNLRGKKVKKRKKERERKKREEFLI